MRPVNHITIEFVARADKRANRLKQVVFSCCIEFWRSEVFYQCGPDVKNFHWRRDLHEGLDSVGNKNLDQG